MSNREARLNRRASFGGSMKNSILTTISKTMDDLRLELRDRDFEILTLKSQLEQAYKYIEKLEKR